MDIYDYIGCISGCIVAIFSIFTIIALIILLYLTIVELKDL
jgi:hypothetical protein